MLNKKAFCLSIFFTLIEILIFLGLSCSFYPKNITSERILPYLPNMFIAIATTWYVVFTYYILKSNEMLRKISTEPFLHFSWYKSDKIENLTFENYLKPSEQISKDFNFKPIDIEQMERYICLILENFYQKKVGKIELKIELKASIPSQENWFEETLKFQREDLNLGPDDPLNITVLDLKCIPKSAKISFSLTDVKYSPIDSSNIFLSGKAGKVSYSCYGITEFKEMLPKPQIEKKGKRK